MKISELLDELMAVRDRCGNVEVRIDAAYDTSIYGQLRDVESVEVCGRLSGRKVIRKDGSYPDDVVVVL